MAVLVLVSCTDKLPSSTDGTTSTVTNKEPAGAITPGQAKDHLVETEGVYTLYSPNGRLAISVDTATDGNMTYKVTRTTDGETVTWVKESKLGISVRKADFFSDVTVTDASVREINEDFRLYGNQRSVNSHCMEAVLSLDSGSFSGDDGYSLEIRAYDNGVAFRYNTPSVGSKVTMLEEHTTYSLRGDISKCWYGVNNQDYESVISAYSPAMASNDIITAPLTAELKGGKGYISIMEGALNESYPGVNLKAQGKSTYSTCFYTAPTLEGGRLTSGWRIINIADTLNDLVNNYNVYTVNEQPDVLFANTDWIEAGRSAWSWCTTHSAPNPDMMKEYTLNAALLGYEYNIIDDGWPSWTSYKAFLKELGEMGEELNVKQLLWGAITAGSSGYNKTPDESSVKTFMKLLEDTHMYGAKVDFWWSEANTNTTALQKFILEEAAKREFVIDFHGCNKNTGLNVTYPNELSREGVRGLENIGNSNTTNYTTYASWLNAQLYTRFLCGHADWTPGTYNAMEIASIICIDSPLMVVASDPADILASPAVEFIKSIPTVWDKTVVLSDSKIGEYSVYAKESSGSWFVGGIASSTRRNAKVDLSEFLPDNGTYTAEIWVDVNGKMEQRIINVTASDKIEIGNLNAGEGFAIRISKLSLGSYGGMIGEIAFNAPEGATVRYTTDGSSPLTSDTAKTAEGSITLTESCRLTVAITDGDGKGTELSYRFNKIDPCYSFSYSAEYNDNLTKISISVGEGARVYYTTDNSKPTVNSTLVEGVLEFTESCTLRYIVVSESNTVEGAIEIRVRNPITAPYSDLPLTDASPVSAVTDWGSIYYDTSMSPANSMAARKITLGGSNLSDGTQFDRGISSNANATYVYAVPEGYTRFVAVAGIDDCVYNNANDRAKASAKIIIAFDGVTAYTSQVFRMGEYVLIDVAVPENASQITITFNDAGDGITCDNVSLAAPGWVR